MRKSPNPSPALTQLNEEETLFRDMVRDWARKTLGPQVARMDREGRFDPRILGDLFKLGLMGIEIPEIHGGAGANFFSSVLAVEELSRVDASAGIVVDVQNTVVIVALMRWGSSDLQKTYLPRLATDTVSSYCLSEAESGSDAFSLKTRATEKGDGWLINGRKLWITNAREAGLFIVFATVDPGRGYKGITAFLVERDFPGLEIGKAEEKMGIRASSTCELILNNVFVPKGNVLGPVGQGYKVAIESLNEGRIGIGAQMIGVAQGALASGVGYAQERVQFGRSISDFQAIRFQLAELATQVEAARLMVYNAARLRDAGQTFVKEAAMAKFHSSVVAERVTSEIVEVFGGYGYTKDFPAEKYFRDAKIGKIYEGTSFMQLQTIAKHLLAG